MAKGAAQSDPHIGSVLVVEDDAVLALSMEDTLREVGAREVTVCASTKEAMAALDRQRPDVLILDVHLVDRDDGWALAELVTQLGTRPPRIVFSTGTPEAIPESIAELGPVLTKPYAPEELIEAVRSPRAEGILAKIRNAISSD